MRRMRRRSLLLSVGLLFALTGCSEFIGGRPDLVAQSPGQLFVLTASDGTMTPDPHENGQPDGVHFVIEFEGISGVVPMFNAVPMEITGSLSTTAFFNSLSFTREDPPMAAIMLPNAQNANQDLIVAGLINPTYDPVAGTLRVHVHIESPSDSHDDGDHEHAHAVSSLITAADEAPHTHTDPFDHIRSRQDAMLPESFGEAVIFVHSDH